MSRHPDLAVDTPPIPKKAVYIAHPLGSDIEQRALNCAFASHWVAWAGLRGVCPMASWITLSGVLDETDENRALGLAIDYAQILRCDEVWLCGPSISAGMAMERDFAIEHEIKVVDLTGLSRDEVGAMENMLVHDGISYPDAEVKRDD